MEQTRKTIRVLVVDDEIADVIAEKLRNNSEEPHFEVEVVASVADGLVVLQREDFDVIVLDMVMDNPGGDANRAGLYFLEQVRALRVTAQTVVLTAFGSQGNTVQTMEEGAFSYVDKTEEGWRILPIKIRLAAEYKRQQERLRETERRAYLSYMAAKVVHDMRSPLTAVTGYADLGLMLVSSLSPGADLSCCFRIIGEQARRIDDMANEVLDIVAGRAHGIDRKKVDFASFINDCQPVLEAVCKSQSAAFKVRNDFSGLVELDPDRIRRVLVNLVANGARAVKARWQNTSTGRVYITAVQERCELIMRVEDNGGGMDANALTNIQEGRTPDQVQGYGLGLQVSMEIVKQHEGKIEIKSALGQGTTFTISLPL